ncbi:NlpC/P60 family protein [Streptomyces sp. KR80]|uniref:NlpC/P60 family protein n=1 Tax=Streptomyces sp. KR80 TaxID=3457426 RepID=UPI003FD4FE2C
MSGRFVRSVRTAAMAAGTALAVAAPTLPPAPAAPADRPVGSLLTELHTLYRKAETANEAYTTTDEQLKKQRHKVRSLGAQLALARMRLADERDAAGRLAREQYRGAAGSLSPYLRLLLSRHPQQILDQSHLLRLAGRDRAATVTRLVRGERRLDGLASKARTALDKQQTLAAKKKRQWDEVQGRLEEVQRVLVSLSPEQLDRLERLERQQVRTARRAAVTTASRGRAVRLLRAPSKAGSRAIGYAIRQLGKPYRWGAEGPDSFDCSGLTSQAWARAGRAIPRTSQEQWRRLPKVSIRSVRPGDLVIYYRGATHVALYIGLGLVVQAPRPGAVVKISPIAANPLLGVVRPDQGDKPLLRYLLPDLPTGASAGDHRGYSSSAAPA